MSPTLPDRGRRRLLNGAATATAAGAAVAVLGPAAAVPAVAPAAAPGKPLPGEAARGYHETEHTRRYYALARF